MKTHIIQLDSHDDLISIRDKMSWAKSPRILLVWPQREQVAIRPLDIRLLQRHACSLGAQMGLVTRDPVISRAAEENNVPVFKSTSDSRPRLWEHIQQNVIFQPRHPRSDLRKVASEVRIPEVGWRNHMVSRVVFFSVGVMAILALVVSLVPSVEIKLALETEAQTITIPIVANPGVQEVNPAGQVPLQQTIVRISAAREVTASGRAHVPIKKAVGRVQFRNLTETIILIPAGTTILSMDSIPVRFITTENGELPAGVDQTLIVSVEAEQPGSRYNLEAGSLQAIEGVLGLSLAVTNLEPMTGGADQQLPALTDPDRSRARETLISSLQEQALAAGEYYVTSGDLLLPIASVKTDSLEEDTKPIVRSASNTYSFTLSADVIIFYIPADALIWLAGLILDPSLPEGYQAVQDSLSYTVVDKAVMGNDGTIHFDLKFERSVHPRLNPFTLIHSIQGCSIQSSRERIKDALTLTQEPEIVMNPSWWPWLPLFPFRYRIEH